MGRQTAQCRSYLSFFGSIVAISYILGALRWVRWTLGVLRTARHQALDDDMSRYTPRGGRWVKRLSELIGFGASARNQGGQLRLYKPIVGRK